MSNIKDINIDSQDILNVNMPLVYVNMPDDNVNAQFILHIITLYVDKNKLNVNIIIFACWHTYLTWILCMLT